MQQVFHGRKCNWITSNHPKTQKGGEPVLQLSPVPRPLQPFQGKGSSILTPRLCPLPCRVRVRARQHPHLNPASRLKGLHGKAGFYVNRVPQAMERIPRLIFFFPLPWNQILFLTLVILPGFLFLMEWNLCLWLENWLGKTIWVLKVICFSNNRYRNPGRKPVCFGC